MRTSQSLCDRTPAPEAFSPAPIQLLLHPRQPTVPGGPTTPARSKQLSQRGLADRAQGLQTNRAARDTRRARSSPHKALSSPPVPGIRHCAEIRLESHIRPDTAERPVARAARVTPDSGSKRSQCPLSLLRFPFLHPTTSRAASAAASTVTCVPESNCT